jgi:predicted RecB family endonuclease
VFIQARRAMSSKQELPSKLAVDAAVCGEDNGVVSADPDERAAAQTALRTFVRSLAQTVARRDWADAVNQLKSKEIIDEKTEDGPDRG